MFIVLKLLHSYPPKSVHVQFSGIRRVRQQQQLHADTAVAAPRRG